MKHTKGPWSASNLSYRIEALHKNGKHTLITEVASNNDADAWLIAAAPEMLELLIELDSLITRDSKAGQTFDSYTVASGILAKIDTVIRKARGEK